MEVINKAQKPACVPIKDIGAGNTFTFPKSNHMYMIVTQAYPVCGVISYVSLVDGDVYEARTGHLVLPVNAHVEVD